MKNKQVLTKNDNIIFEEIDGGGMLLYDNQSREIHILNETAAVIFDSCNEKPIDLILESFLDNFEINEYDLATQKKISQDLYDTIAILKEKSIVLESSK